METTKPPAKPPVKPDPCLVAGCRLPRQDGGRYCFDHEQARIIEDAIAEGLSRQAAVEVARAEARKKRLEAARLVQLKAERRSKRAARGGTQKKRSAPSHKSKPAVPRISRQMRTDAQRRRRARYRRLGICVQCGGAPSLGDGARRCRPCIRKKHPSGVPRKVRPETAAASRKRYYERCKKRGQCVSCHMRAVPGRVRCVHHGLLDAQRPWESKRGKKGLGVKIRSSDFEGIEGLQGDV